MSPRPTVVTFYEHTQQAALVLAAVDGLLIVNVQTDTDNAGMILAPEDIPGVIGALQAYYNGWRDTSK